MIGGGNRLAGSRISLRSLRQVLAHHLHQPLLLSNSPSGTQLLITTSSIWSSHDLRLFHHPHLPSSLLGKRIPSRVALTCSLPAFPSCLQLLQSPVAIAAHSLSSSVQPRLAAVRLVLSAISPSRFLQSQFSDRCTHALARPVGHKHQTRSANTATVLSGVLRLWDCVAQSSARRINSQAASEDIQDV